MKSKNKRNDIAWIAPVLIACTLLMFGCSAKESTPKTPILIEGVVISETGHPRHKESIDHFMIGKTSEVMKISSKFSNHLTGTFAIDHNNPTSIQSQSIPTLTLNGKSLNLDHAIPEKLSSEISGVVATLFVKNGSEFVRVSTSLKKAERSQTMSDEERAVGSTLSHTHPAYNACLSGNSYTGTATLFGSIYMTEYTPIKDAKGEVIGIKFVGMDISSDLILLKRKLLT